MSFLKKIGKRIHWQILRPIAVFVFHHVSDEHDPLICGKEDWTQNDVFKQRLLHLKKDYIFISMQEAITHLKQDKFRFKKFAVLTADDGLRSTYELLPWLIENNIPITLFISPKYLDGRSYVPIDELRVRAQYPDADMEEIASRMFITPEQLQSLTTPLVTVASHGYAHVDAANLSEHDFERDVLTAKKVIENHPLYKPYFAYPWGHHSANTDEWLIQKGLLPVLCDGKLNYKWNGVISRLCIDNMVIE